MDTFYVGFRNSDGWFKHLLMKGFGHCSVLIPCQDSWLEIDPAYGILQFRQLTDGQLSHYTKVIRVKINGYKFNKFPLKFFSCVRMVEYMLGKSIHAFTPYHLYKKLTGSLKSHFNTQEII